LLRVVVDARRGGAWTARWSSPESPGGDAGAARPDRRDRPGRRGLEAPVRRADARAARSPRAAAARQARGRRLVRAHSRRAVAGRRAGGNRRAARRTGPRSRGESVGVPDLDVHLPPFPAVGDIDPANDVRVDPGAKPGSHGDPRIREYLVQRAVELSYRDEGIDP